MGQKSGGGRGVGQGISWQKHFLVEKFLSFSFPKRRKFLLLWKPNKIWRVLLLGAVFSPEGKGTLTKDNVQLLTQAPSLGICQSANGLSTQTLSAQTEVVEFSGVDSITSNTFF